MRFLLKLIGLFGAAIATLKIAEITIDFLYDAYGKKYFTTLEE